MPKLMLVRRLISLTMLLAVSTVKAGEIDECKQVIRLGSEALKASELSVETLKQLRQTDAEAIKMLIEQRNKAIEANSKEAGLPFYVWLLVGGAATTILIRGVK